MTKKDTVTADAPVECYLVWDPRNPTLLHGAHPTRESAEIQVAKLAAQPAEPHPNAYRIVEVT